LMNQAIKFVKIVKSDRFFRGQLVDRVLEKQYLVV